MSHLYPCEQTYKGGHSVINAWYKWRCDNIYLMLGFIVTITVIYVMPLLPSFGELATHTVDTSRCGVTCQCLHHLVSSSVCTQLSNGPIGSCESFMQLHCTIQNKYRLISIDLTINSCREFEFTIKTMNSLLSESSIYLL